MVDKAAKDSRHHQHIIPVKPSINHIKSITKKTTYQIERIPHEVWIQAGSPSAKWFITVTDCESITIPHSIPSKEAVIIRRLRLGYRCSWEVEERLPGECIHCQAVVSQPIISWTVQLSMTPDQKNSLALMALNQNSANQ